MDKQQILTDLKVLMTDLEGPIRVKGGVESIILDDLRRIYGLINDTCHGHQAIKNSAALLSRFYVDHLDWDTDLFKRLSALNNRIEDFARSLKG